MILITVLLPLLYAVPLQKRSDGDLDFNDEMSTSSESSGVTFHNDVGNSISTIDTENLVPDSPTLERNQRFGRHNLPNGQESSLPVFGNVPREPLVSLQDEQDDQVRGLPLEDPTQTNSIVQPPPAIEIHHEAASVPSQLPVSSPVENVQNQRYFGESPQSHAHRVIFGQRINNDDLISDPNAQQQIDIDRQSVMARHHLSNSTSRILDEVLAMGFDDLDDDSSVE